MLLRPLPPLLVGLLFLVSSSALAATITEFESHRCGLQTNRGTVTACGLTVEYPPRGGNVTLFDQVLVEPDDTGAVFSADPASNPSFGAFVELLTNGRDEILRTATTTYVDGEPFGGNASSQSESRWFEDSPTRNGIDLEGYEIESIDLRVDSVTVLPPDESRNFPHPGLRVRSSLVFNGTLIPEPSPTALLAIGLVLLCMVARHRSRHRRLAKA